MHDPKTCTTCVYCYPDAKKPKYLRCRVAEASVHEDAALCGEMRKAACGPEAKLWEPRNG